MKVKCITNKTVDVPKEIIVHYELPSFEKKLIIDKEYVVYVIGEIYQHIWYCICDEQYRYFPWWIPQWYFEISDPRLSRYWIASFVKDKPKNRLFLGFPEWVNQEDFYDNLVDGEYQEKQIFKAYKERMDLEFPDASIVDFPQVLDSEWLMCPICIDAWQSIDSKDALIKCPKCQKLYNNPRFNNELPHF